MEYFVSDFLNSYEFHPNSVDFRIVSSKSMEKFKKRSGVSIKRNS